MKNALVRDRTNLTPGKGGCRPIGKSAAGLPAEVADSLYEKKVDDSGLKEECGLGGPQ